MDADPDSARQDPVLGFGHFPNCGTVLHGESFFVHTKGGKKAANYLSNPQITFLRHGRQMLRALCFHQTQGCMRTLPMWVSCCYEKNKETRLGGCEKWQPLPSGKHAIALLPPLQRRPLSLLSKQRNLSSERVAGYKGRVQNVCTSQSPQFCLNKRIDWV